MKALDLYCGAGGATKGLQRAGFHVTGVDIKAQPRYCGDVFIQADAMTLPIDFQIFDLVWTSPPCQAHTALKTMHNAKKHVDLIAATRNRLKLQMAKKYVIENVMGAPLENPIMLCGTMFGLGIEDAELRRHRIFETNFPVLTPKCQHGKLEVIGVYGGHVRNIKRRTIGIYGEGCRDSRRKTDKGVADFSIDQGRKAMEIDWMTTAELSQAIPPAYSEYLARAAISARRAT